MDMNDLTTSNSSSPRNISDIEMSTSGANSSISTVDENDVKVLYNDTKIMDNLAEQVENLITKSKTSNASGWVKLNIGGKTFQTTRSTLMREPGSFLYRLCQEEQGLSTDKDEDGAYLIDRDPEYFSPILNYLRHGKVILPIGMSEDGILVEADFYNLPILSQLLTERIHERDVHQKEKSTIKFVYRVLQCHEEELASVVSAMTDGWKIVQVVPINSNYSTYTSDQQQEYLCIVERECPDNGTMGESQDRAKLLQQRARHN